MGVRAESLSNVICAPFSVQESGQAEHSAAGNRQLGPTGQVSNRLCDGV